MLLLHGEQYLELLQPLQTSANLQIKTDIVDITQKGKNTVVVIGVTLIDEDSKKKTSYAEATIFLRGARPSKSGNYLSVPAQVLLPAFPKCSIDPMSVTLSFRLGLRQRYISFVWSYPNITFRVHSNTLLIMVLASLWFTLIEQSERLHSPSRITLQLYIVTSMKPYTEEQNNFSLWWIIMGTA